MNTLNCEETLHFQLKKTAGDIYKQKFSHNFTEILTRCRVSFWLSFRLWPILNEFSLLKRIEWIIFRQLANSFWISNWNGNLFRLQFQFRTGFIANIKCSIFEFTLGKVLALRGLSDKISRWFELANEWRKSFVWREVNVFEFKGLLTDQQVLDGYPFFHSREQTYVSEHRKIEHLCSVV